MSWENLIWFRTLQSIFEKYYSKKSFLSSRFSIAKDETWRLSFFYPSIYYLIGIYSLLVLLVCLLKSFKELFLYSCLNSCLDCRFVLLVESVFLKSECKGTEIFSFHKTFSGKISIFSENFCVAWCASKGKSGVTLIYFICAWGDLCVFDFLWLLSSYTSFAECVPLKSKWNTEYSFHSISRLSMASPWKVSNALGGSISM